MFLDNKDHEASHNKKAKFLQNEVNDDNNLFIKEEFNIENKSKSELASLSTLSISKEKLSSESNKANLHIKHNISRNDSSDKAILDDLIKPVNTIKDKWRLLPHFLKTEGLVKHHIDSYNYFVSTEIQSIVRANANRIIRSDVDPSFFIEFLDARVGFPRLEENMITVDLTPMMCRMRDLTYAAPIYVDVDYVRGNTVVRKKNVEIGRIPVMLRSKVCILHGKNSSEMVKLNECPHDPGGYFIVKGTEKAILMQEQLSKNRIIVELDNKHNYCATVTSTTAESKSRTLVVLKNGRLYLRHNSFVDEIPLCIVLKAMGIETEQEIFHMVGTEPHHEEGIINSLQEVHQEGIFTQRQALLYMSKRAKSKLRTSGPPGSSNVNNSGVGSRSSRTSARGSTGNSGNYSQNSFGGMGDDDNDQFNNNINDSLACNNNFNNKHGSSMGTGIDEVLETLNRVLLSHIGTIYCDLYPKAIFLSLMAKRVLDSSKDQTLLDDKDYYGNKRIELAGQLISILFEDLFKRFSVLTKKQIDQTLVRYFQTKDAGKLGGRGGAISGSGINDDPNLSYPDCFRNLPTDIITRGMQTALSTGNWSIKRFRMERSGMTQVLTRFSYIASLGIMTRVDSQFEKARKVSGPRALQPSQWGILCPCDTPEGESCGLVKNLALTTHITTDHCPQYLVGLLLSLGVQDICSSSCLDWHSSQLNNKLLCNEISRNLTGLSLSPNLSPSLNKPYSASQPLSSYFVFINGSLMGIHRNPELLATQIRLLRRKGYIGQFVSVFCNHIHCYVQIATDGGRLCRPLIIVDKGVSRLKEKHIEMLESGEMAFGDCISNGILEWVDVNEENNLLIALRDEDITLETTHLEIDPLSILGVVSGLIPYPNHNQSPRNTYQCAMGKQVMGSVGFNQFLRCDSVLYLLVYPQKPLCKTRTIEMINFEELPAGQNSSVAVMSFAGYDIEDAIVMNKASVDRGFARCFVMKRQTVELQKLPNGLSERVACPNNSNTSQIMCCGAGNMMGRTSQSISTNNNRTTNNCKNNNTGSSDYYKKIGNNVSSNNSVLDEDGVCNVGALVTEDDIIVNKMSPINTREYVGDPSQIDLSEYKPTPIKYKGPSSSYVDRVILTENSDGNQMYKVILRQTRRPELGDKFSSRHGQKGVVGLIISQEDLPFSETGWCPDLIMNPHGFPSRMTVGKLMELISSKASVLDGKYRYGTAFGGTPLEESAKCLIENGFHYSGKEYLTSGTTGEAIESYIFVGPIFYQKLKHMVLDKMHARGRGPRQILTRQPTEGRSKDGGLRLGEMERDCLVAYGASNLLIERLMLNSDVFETNVCNQCGLFGYNNYCRYCDNSQDISIVRLPYACKLLFQELQAMNVCPRIRTCTK
ncbi:DNA-directed RNA polymerase beta subunit [Cryptosporidium bovis]|uniref:DNA-directed RNA polymerase beta subunit n=1 Tax=Cryptosporidium bovis TaxID=310047 RepID=UPI00351AA2C2|nr:DNA-directed RNA polymerase beta subunit [Cryptosporidium bovis]